MTNTTSTATYEVKFKATKADVVTRLLQEGKITAEECVILLMAENTGSQVVYVPYTPPNWVPNTIPWYPSYPVIY